MLALVCRVSLFDSLTLPSERSFFSFGLPVNDTIAFSLAQLGLTTLALAEPV